MGDGGPTHTSAFDGRGVLPPITRPWANKLVRRHAPPQAGGKRGYRRYRSCLRWEFGFSCAFCLVHDADLALCGTEGWGITTIEHFVPSSHDPQQLNTYENCFYACGRCNRARKALANINAAGAALLNPCTTPWNKAFEASRDRLKARAAAGPNARYTEETYELNHPTKVACRRWRREVISERVEFLENSRTMIRTLLDAAARGGGGTLVALAKALERHRRAAVADLLRYRAVPADHDRSCRCSDESKELVLPVVLQEQLLDLRQLLQTA